MDFSKCQYVLFHMKKVLEYLEDHLGTFSKIIIRDPKMTSEALWLDLNVIGRYLEKLYLFEAQNCIFGIAWVWKSWKWSQIQNWWCFRNFDILNFDGWILMDFWISKTLTTIFSISKSYTPMKLRITDLESPWSECHSAGLRFKIEDVWKFQIFWILMILMDFELSWISSLFEYDLSRL